MASDDNPLNLPLAKPVDIEGQLPLDDVGAAPIRVYSVGLCYASVCAPLAVSREEVEAAVNEQYPTGLDQGWTIREESFHSGHPNPCPCNDSPGRLHYLLQC